GRAIAAAHVIGGPLRQVERGAAPGHLGEQVEGERIGVHALGEHGGADHVRVGPPHALQARGDVAGVGAQGGAAAEFPQTAEQERRALEILLAVVARYPVVVDVDDEQVLAVDPVSRSWRGLPCQASIIQPAPGCAFCNAACTSRAASGTGTSPELPPSWNTSMS